MPMGIVTDKEFEQEIQNSQKVTIPSRIPDSRVEIVEKGRGTGNVEVPNVLRNIIADTHHAQGREAALSLAESFHISPSSESAYAQGAVSTASYHERPNKKAVNQTKKRISDKAAKITESAMDHITDEKLEEASATELALIAKNTASIVKAMDPEEDNGAVNPLNISPIVIYSPQIKNENTFEMVFSKE